MTLITAVAVLWGTWALLRFWVRERLLPVSPEIPFMRLALRTAIDQLVVVSLAAAAALTAMQLLLWSTSLAGVANVAFLRGVLSFIATSSDHVSAWSEAMGTTLLILLTLATAVLWHLHARQQSRQRITRALELEIERILREREANPEEWNSLPPNEAMEQIDGILSVLHDQWQAVRRDATLDEATRLRESNAIEAEATRLMQLRQGLDVRRRVEHLDPPENEPATWRERLMIALASRGLIADARNAASYLGIFATILTLLTTVGFASGPVASAALVSVNRLELRAERQSVEHALGAAAPAGTSADVDHWTDEDERALQQLSNVIVRTTFESRSFPVPLSEPASAATPASTSGPAATRQPPDEWAEPADAWEHSRRDQVRRGILQSVDTASAPIAEPTADGVERIVQAATDSKRHEATVARVAAQTQARLRDEIRGRPTLLRAFRAHAAEYQQVIHPADLRAGLVSALFGHVTGEIDLPPALEHIVLPMVEDTGETVLHEYLRVQELRALESLARGQPFSDTLDRIRYSSEVSLRYSRTAARESTEVLAAHADEVRAWLDRVQPTAKPAGDAATTDALRTASAIVESTSEQPREAVEALATYDDYFPARPRGEESTSLGSLEHQILQARAPTTSSPVPDTPAPSAGAASGGGGGSGGGGFGGGGSGRPAARESARISYARSRSFSMARGFARVGGVLIGRPPERHPQTLNVTAIGWTENGGNVSLRLGGSQSRTLGPFPASAVDRALQYAADGRVTTVTMTSAAPLFELKILLNPVLEDSSIGAAAIELDRFVDTYARKVPSVRAEETRIQGQYALYVAAWTLRQIALLEIIAKHRGDAEQQLQRARSRVERLLPSIDAALRQPRGDLMSPQRSILAAKPAFFDMRLVRLIDSAAAAGGAEAWRNELLASFTAAAEATLTDRARGENAIKEWFGEPARFEVWSGVREQPWTADPAFGFVATPANDELWPFQFMLQASFVSEPKFGDGKPDDSPFEYTNVSADIRSAVARGIHSPEGMRSNHPRVVEQMREFAVLQRVFRLALAGQLGRNFPLERLTDLAAVVRPHRTVERTPRWNVRPGMIETFTLRVLDDLQRTAVESTPELVGKFQACRGVVSPQAPQEAWEQQCAFASEIKQYRASCTSSGEHCALAERLAGIESLTHARRLRQELGVQKDDVLLEERRAHALESAR
jgi:hypothetical protein